MTMTLKGFAWLTDWRPGFAIPARFTTTIDGDWLPYRVELDLAVNDDEVSCSAVKLEAREDGEPVTARGMRGIPLGECIRLATASALRPTRHEAGQVVVDLLGPRAERRDNMAEQELASRGPQRRMSEDWLREAAEIYSSAEEKPTQAVERLHSQAPISYSTAARWVMQARQRGFLPPTKRGRGRSLASSEED
jgi:hypothetical protein